MANDYKLYYFNFRGLGDVNRQIFALAHVPFEDVRIEQDEWAERKNETPFGQMPVLETKGIQIPQSLAIARYLSNKFGFAGKTDEEKALVDGFADQFKDFFVEQKPYYLSKMGFYAANPDEELRKSLIPARDKFLPLLTKSLKNSKSGFLVDSGVTYADLMICDQMRSLLNWWPQYADDYPEVLAWFKKVDAIPEIRQHIEKSNSEF